MATYTKYETFLNTNSEEDTRQIRKAYRGRPYVFLREKFMQDTQVAYPSTDGVGMPSDNTVLNHPPVIQTAMNLQDGPTAESDDLPF